MYITSTEVEQILDLTGLSVDSVKQRLNRRHKIGQHKEEFIIKSVTFQFRFVFVDHSFVWTPQSLCHKKNQSMLAVLI